MAKIRTHYDNLRVARNAPDSVIKAAYKALCQTYHPDKFQGSNAEAERIMKLINTSYTVLIDSVKRAEHDAWIRKKEAAANQQHEKATFGETGEATEQTYQKQETKREYTPPPTQSCRVGKQFYRLPTIRDKTVGRKALPTLHRNMLQRHAPLERCKMNSYAGAWEL